MTTQITRIEQFTADAVRNVFSQMLSMEVSPENSAVVEQDPGDHIIGSVGFVGEVTGIVYLYAGLPFATGIASRMLGMEPSELDTAEMVNDAFGELTNMVVGSVKSRLCDEGMPCVLTIPSIVRGQQLRVESSAQSARRVIGFRNSEHRLKVEIILKQPQSR